MTVPLDAAAIRAEQDRRDPAIGRRPVTVMRGGDPSYVGDELLYAIKAQIARHPRSLQKELGPSEIGDPCTRRLGYKLLQHPEVNHDTNWYAWIGTNVHNGLAEALNAENADTNVDRYVAEETLFCGTINGRLIFGHGDAYDRTTCGVVDWKVVGPTQLKHYRANGPGQQYRVQTHTYGKGWTLRGFPVDWVSCMFLPRNGELDEAYFWHEPYDQTVADEAFTRVEGIDLAVKAGGLPVLEQLPTADAYCTRCPFYRFGSTDLTTGCPGDPSIQKAADKPALTLI